MKKTSFASLVIIIGLLALCVTTLIAIYATAPGSSVLLLDEHFSGSEESKWKHEIFECKDGRQFRYVTRDMENRSVADGVLHMYSNFTNLELRSKREIISECPSCFDSKNSSPGCVSSSLFAELQSEHVFNASWGRIQVRAKLRKKDQRRFYIGITSGQNNSEAEKTFESFLEPANETNSAQLKIFLDSVSNETIVRSEITDSEFHVYEINWNRDEFSLSVDGEKVGEKTFALTHPRGQSISNMTVESDSAAISQPFHISIGVEFGRSEAENSDFGSAKERSSGDEPDHEKNDREEESVLEVDYIRLFRILN